MMACWFLGSSWALVGVRLEIACASCTIYICIYGDNYYSFFSFSFSFLYLSFLSQSMSSTFVVFFSFSFFFSVSLPYSTGKGRSEQVAVYCLHTCWVKPQYYDEKQIS